MVTFYSSAMSLGQFISYQVIPPLFLVLFTSAAQYLAQVGNPERPFNTDFLLGNVFAWKVIGSFFAWTLIWLWIPSKKFRGPTTSFGYTPIYQANGELYYLGSTVMFGLIAYFHPEMCVSIYENMGSILGGLNIVALSLCLYLLVRAKLETNSADPYLRKSEFPIFHEFYRGMELHPRILGVDVKQLTNCRMGMMMWQLLILVYFVAAWKLHGFNGGHLVNVGLQTIYIYKFFRWETGYFNTLDITLDRAGYYICWGCLVWIPSFYTFSSYFFVFHQPTIGSLVTGLIMVLGIAMIYLNYSVDRQKELFRTDKTGNLKIWGQKPKSLRVSYMNGKGEKKSTDLLLSGWWGLARKINYTFELLAAFTWSAPALADFGVFPYLYFFFLFILLVHRIFRDENKCHEKYGRGWTEYCKKVPHRLIPYVF